MIARTVHQHTPKAQLKFEYFKSLEIEANEMTSTKNLVDIDSIPCYV